MAYEHRGGFGNPSPILDAEHRPSPWVQRDHGHHRHHSQYQSPAMKDIMDPESEDSDVSGTEGDYSSTFSFPINLPAAPSKPALENVDTITAHLKELERVDAHNVRKHERLKEKRARKDDRIARKRAAQDERIKAIMDSRARHDSRIAQRRQRENIAFQRFYEDLDEEETRLQGRLKRLKRGHLVEDAAPGHRRVSLNSTSPPVPAYSTIPPPAKRHQTSHPNHTEGPPPYQPPPAAHQPSYHFHPGPGPSHQNPTPYNTGPPYRSPSYGRSPPVASHSRIGSNLHEGPNNRPNGQNASPRLPPPTSTPASATMPAPLAATTPMPIPMPMQTPNPHTQPAHNQPPPRQSSATYDTRPPPPHASSFAAINHPSNSGFAAINSVPNAPPATPHVPALKEEQPKQTVKPTDHTPVRTSSQDEKPSAGGSAGNKRTPSTTHPYQMSEAFANRHHHCERTDSLNRGIWTWYGMHGTKEHPTGPPTEMYLVCNHDGCRRIDWRTVHGLQCHIVKNHEQPKGTIGSLEKALAAYGVPVQQIEDYERQHGPGSGGTMADPKNSKPRTKAKDVADRRDLSERDSPVSVSAPLHLKKHQSYDSESPQTVHAPLNNIGGRKRSHSIDEHVIDSGSEHTPIEAQRQPNARAVSGFPAVNTSWQGINSTPSKPPHAREWQAHPAMTSEKRTPNVIGQPPPTNPNPTPFWPSWHAKNEVSAPRPPPPTPPRAINTPLVHAPLPTTPQAAPETVPQPQQPDQKEVKPISMPENQAQAHSYPIQQKDQPPDVQTRRDVVQQNETPDETKPVVHVDTEVVRDTPMTEPKTSVEDVPMTNSVEAAEKQQQDIVMTDTTERQLEELPRQSTPRPSPNIPATTPQQEPQTPKPRDNNDHGTSRPKETEHDRPTPSRDTRTSSPKKDGRETKSPEMSNKRISSSRKGSRRPSTATGTSTKIGTDRLKDDDLETNYTANTTSKAESVDDDSDSITVNLIASTGGQRDRDDRTKTPIRLANGRFSRTRRQR